jgi:PKD repeat protein
MALSGVSVRDAQQTLKFSLSAAASTGNSYVGLVSRQSSANDYTVRAYMQSNGAVMLIAKASSVTLTSTSVPGLTWSAGTDYMLKTEVTGASPTTIRAKIWAAGTAEPASWQLSTTDSSAGPQSAAAPNVHFARAGSATSASTVSVDDYRLVNLQGAPANAAPVAAFTSTVSGLTASVDGSGSSDAEGAIASYSWNWGDNSAAGTGATASHAYTAAGTYQVVLTVTDAGGLTNSITKPVTVTAPAGGPDLSAFAAADDFGRSATSGWGNSDKGGAWSALYGAASAASVSGGVGQITLPAGQTRNMALSGVSLLDTTMTTDFSLAEAPATGSSYVGVVARQNATDNYQVRVWLRNDGTVWLVTQRGSTVLNTYAVPGITRGAGESFTLKAQFVGSGTTTIQAKLWRTGETEPAAWQIVSADATPGLQVAGSIAVHTNRGGSATSTGTFTFDNLRVTAQ